MNRPVLLVCVSAAAFGAASSLAQIPFVTVRTPRSPGPSMALVQTNAPPATAAPAAPTPQTRVVRPPAPLPKPSLTKSELERRVVAFQQRRAQEGSASAQYELGLRYLRGDGVVKDDANARKWLAAAAGQGHEPARAKLAELGEARK